MAQVHLPQDHTEDDLALAGALARILECGELYVAWSAQAGSARPVVPAQVHTPAPAQPPPRGWLRRLLSRGR